MEVVGVTPAAMDEAWKAEFTRRIQEQLRALEADAERLREKTKPVAPDNAIGRLTRMDAIQSRGMFEASLEKALSGIERLTQTLARLDQPGFGLCHGCRKPIPVERLLLIPDATRCVGCAS